SQGREPRVLRYWHSERCVKQPAAAHKQNTFASTEQTRESADETEEFSHSGNSGTDQQQRTGCNWCRPEQTEVLRQFHRRPRDSVLCSRETEGRGCRQGPGCRGNLKRSEML